MSEKTPSSMPLIEVLRIRAKTTGYDTKPTDTEVVLKVEQGSDPELLPKTVGQLATAGRLFNKFKGQANRATKRKETKSDLIKKIAMDHEGLRGYTNEAENLSVTVFPVYDIDYDSEKLKESLGPAWSSIVTEKIVTTMFVPHDYPTQKGPLTSKKMEKAAKRGIRRLGFSKGDLTSIVHSEVVQTVDEFKLLEWLEDEQSSLIQGAVTIEESWKARSDPIEPTKKI